MEFIIESPFIAWSMEIEHIEYFITKHKYEEEKKVIRLIGKDITKEVFLIFEKGQSTKNDTHTFNFFRLALSFLKSKNEFRFSQLLSTYFAKINIIEIQVVKHSNDIKYNGFEIPGASSKRDFYAMLKDFNIKTEQIQLFTSIEEEYTFYFSNEELGNARIVFKNEKELNSFIEKLPQLSARYEP